MSQGEIAKAAHTIYYPLSPTSLAAAGGGGGKTSPSTSPPRKNVKARKVRRRRRRRRRRRGIVGDTFHGDGGRSSRSGNRKW